MKPQQLHLFGPKTKSGKASQKEGIIIPVDTTIFLLVVIILLMALSFSWGVNRGRKLALRDLSAGSKTQNRLRVKKPAAKPAKGINQKPDKNSQQKKAAKPPAGKNEAAKKTLYQIQVASFYKPSSARQEAERLKKKGFPVKIGQKGRYSVVYVGNFENKKEAKASLKKLKTTYRDCLLRRL